MMKRNFSKLATLKYFTLGTLTMILVACRGGSSGDNQAIAPQSLNGVTLQIAQNRGPSMSFIAGRGQDPGEGGTETGAFTYNIGNQGNGFRLSEISATIVDGFLGEAEFTGQLRKWPDDIANGRYRYTPQTQGTAARLEFWGNLVNDTIVTRITDSGGVTTIEEALLFWGNPTSGEPMVFDLSFDAGNGNSITNTAGILATPRVDVVIDPEDPFDLFPDVVEIEIPLTLESRLTSGGPVPAGWTTDYDGPSDIFTGELADQPVTFTDDVDGTRIIYNFVNNGLGGGNQFDPDILESGSFTATYDAQEDPTLENRTLAGNYMLTAIEGTDTFELDLDYNESTSPDLFTDGLVMDGIVTLDFGIAGYARPTPAGNVIGEFTLE
jgi:hypothetical protein